MVYAGAHLPVSRVLLINSYRIRVGRRWRQSRKGQAGRRPLGPHPVIPRTLIHPGTLENTRAGRDTVTVDNKPHSRGY